MATVEQCLYCFEVLASKLQGLPHMSLFEIEESWAEYPKGSEDDSDEEAEDPDENKAGAPGASVPNVSSTTLSSTSSGSKPASSVFSKSSTPSSAATSAASSRPPTSTSMGKPETTYTPVGQSKRSAQSQPITTSPLFVTWNKISPTSHTRSLRGCIGTFEPQELASGIRSYSLTSALQDTRFNPITARELPALEVSVTLLTDFEPCADPMDWELGVHGIKISFYERHRRYSATYLPDVAVEQGWDKEETIESLMRKAGWSGRKDWRELAELRVVRYQGRKESVEYEEFNRWREWVDGKKK
jgi:uncharacterized protein (TIGR00296 family)